MGYIVGMIIAALILLPAWYFLRKYSQKANTAAAVYKAREDSYHYEESMGAAKFSKWAAFGCLVTFILIFGLVTVFRSYHAINAGEVGVVYQFGAIEGDISEGVNWIAPWNSVKVQDVKVQKKTYDLEAVSKETQDVFATVTVNLSMNPENVQRLYREVGPDWYERIVPNRVQQAFKNTTVRYATVEIAPNREEVKRLTRESLQASVNPYSITINDVNIENIKFSDEFNKAIEAKQVATQEAQRQEQLVKARQAEAEQAVAFAKGQAEANRLVAESLRTNPEIVELRKAEYQRDAVIALAKEGTVQMIPSNVLFTQPAQATP